MALAPIPIPDLASPTPVAEVGDVWVKRDDLFTLHGVNGSKVYEALAVIDAHPDRPGLLGYGGRRSNTAAAMAAAAKERGVGAIFYCPHGRPTREMEVAKSLGALVRREKPGYLSQCRSAAMQEAGLYGWPVGLEHEAAIAAVAAQVANLPLCDRVVVAVGSGVLLTGIVVGLREFGHPAEVLGVVCGGGGYLAPLDLYAPGWRGRVEVVHSGFPYEAEAVATHYGGIPLDPIYEGKAVRHLLPGDLLWNSGYRV